MKENPGVEKIEKIKLQTSDIRNIFCSMQCPNIIIISIEMCYAINVPTNTAQYE